jgi:hypothetical protein
MHPYGLDVYCLCFVSLLMFVFVLVFLFVSMSVSVSEFVVVSVSWSKYAKAEIYGSRSGGRVNPERRPKGQPLATFSRHWDASKSI